MKIAIVSTYDLEGGAARAAYRLHQALSQAGHESVMFVQQRSGADPSVSTPPGNVQRLWGRVRWRIDQLPARLAGASRGSFSVNWLGGSLHDVLQPFAPDVVHLHWINAGYVSLGEVRRLAGAVLWTAHDMWPFTGGCHYDAGCGNFGRSSCSPCPMQLTWPTAPLARRRLAAKKSAAARTGMHFVAPSRWMASVAGASPVSAGRPVTVIPNAIDTERFRPVDRLFARQLYGIAPDRTVLLFGGVLSNSDPRKGFQLLDAALAQLAAAGGAERVSLCVFGSATRGDATIHGIPVRYVGHLHDEESLVALYSAADLFVAPSLQDNLPNTVMEAAACGVATVAFDIGGLRDLVEHGVSGWLARAGDAADLARQIAAAVADPASLRAAGLAARLRAEERFSFPVVAESHLRQYQATIDALGARR